MTLNIKSPVKVKQDRAFDRIISFFKLLIQQGKIRPGDRLIPERELSKQMDVSRTSLREAFNILETFGIISRERKVGSHILTPNFRSLSSLFEMMLSLKPSISSNIAEARMLIEYEAVRVATHRATPEDLAELEIILERMLENTDDEDLGAKNDFDFHMTIIKATHNDILVSIYEIIQNLLKRSHYERRRAIWSFPEAKKKLYEAHKRVYLAMLNKEPDKARNFLEENFRNTDRLIEIIKKS